MSPRVDQGDALLQYAYYSLFTLSIGMTGMTERYDRGWHEERAVSSSHVKWALLPILRTWAEFHERTSGAALVPWHLVSHITSQDEITGQLTIAALFIVIQMNCWLALVNCHIPVTYHRENLKVCFVHNTACSVLCGIESWTREYDFFWTIIKLSTALGIYNIRENPFARSLCLPSSVCSRTHPPFMDHHMDANSSCVHCKAHFWDTVCFNKPQISHSGVSPSGS